MPKATRQFGCGVSPDLPIPPILLSYRSLNEVQNGRITVGPTAHDFPVKCTRMSIVPLHIGHVCCGLEVGWELGNKG